MNGIKMRLPVGATASHTRFGALYDSTGLKSPFDSSNLLNSNQSATWNAGRKAPVSLKLDLGETKAIVGLVLIPHMNPKRGTITLVLSTDNTTAITPYSATWDDRIPITILWTDPVETRFITIDFLHSTSWVAIRSIEIAEAGHETLQLTSRENAPAQ